MQKRIKVFYSLTTQAAAKGEEEDLSSLTTRAVEKSKSASRSRAIAKGQEENLFSSRSFPPSSRKRN